MKNELDAYCELYWWNMGERRLSFKGQLKDLLKLQQITFTKAKTKIDGFYTFKFKNPFGITFKVNAPISDFRHYAKQFLQMELVRLGDKSQLYVRGSFRPTVTVNFYK